LHFNHAKVAWLVLVSDGGVLEVVSEVADRRYVEEKVIVGERDPEGAVIFVNKVDLLLGGLGPAVRLVGPVAIPFFLSPRIANFDEALGAAVV
jgi:hypothetical protein